MTNKNAPYRPGLAAIAAVLALSSTPVIAQVALPADPAAPAPAAPAPAPAMTPAPAEPQAPVQTVQSVPATPALPDIPVNDTTSAKAPAHTTVARTEAPSAPRRSAVTEQRPAAPAPAAKVAEPNVAPIVTPAPERAAPPTSERQITPTDTARTTTPENAAPATVARDGADGSNYAGWAVLGGGLLLVAGGAAFALSRRPKRRDEVVEYDTADAVAVHPAPLPAAPAMAMREPRHDLVPPRAAPASVVASTAMKQRQPQPVALDRDYAEMPADDRRTALEAMVAEAPSDANPFHSRRNRLRRASFLLRTGQAAPRQGEYVVTEDRVPEAAAASTDRWSEMRFQGRQKTNISWRPARR